MTRCKIIDLKVVKLTQFVPFLSNICQAGLQAATSDTKAGRQNLKGPDKVKEHGKHGWHKECFAAGVQWVWSSSMWVAVVGMSKSTQLLKGRLKRDRISKLWMMGGMWHKLTLFLSQSGCFFFCRVGFAKNQVWHCTNWVISEGARKTINKALHCLGFPISLILLCKSWMQLCILKGCKSFLRVIYIQLSEQTLNS